MSLNCTEKSQFPAGNLTCDDFQDTTETPGRCVGAIGHTCTIDVQEVKQRLVIVMVHVLMQ